MNPDAAGGRVALRIDVDFPVGLLRAVPFFLDRLRAAEMKATFFVVAGSNDPRSSWRRMVRPQYARLLEEFLEQAARDGITTMTLDDAATAVRRSAAVLDLCRLQRGRLPGFDGEVSWPGQAVALPASTVAGVSA